MTNWDKGYRFIILILYAIIFIIPMIVLVIFTLGKSLKLYNKTGQSLMSWVFSGDKYFDTENENE